MTTSENRPALLSLAIIALTLATAIIHIVLAIPAGLLMFYANGLGYVALLGAIHLPLPTLDRYRRAARYALLAYTAVTVLGWVAFGARDTIGYIDKAIEVALIVLLLIEIKRNKKRSIG